MIVSELIKFFCEKSKSKIKFGQLCLFNFFFGHSNFVRQKTCLVQKIIRKICSPEKCLVQNSFRAENSIIHKYLKSKYFGQGRKKWGMVNPRGRVDVMYT